MGGTIGACARIPINQARNGYTSTMERASGQCRRTTAWRDTDTHGAKARDYAPMHQQRGEDTAQDRVLGQEWEGLEPTWGKQTPTVW